MKKYLSFNLTGGKLFPYFIIYLLAVIIYSVTAEYPKLSGGDITETDSTFLILLLGSLLFMLFTQVIYIFYISKYSINAISYKEKSVICIASLTEFVKIWVVGVFLSIITIGIYYPWLIRNCTAYMTRKTSIDSEALNFNGKGSKLFLYLLLPLIAVVFISVILIIIVSALTTSGGIDPNNVQESMGVFFITFFIVFIIVLAVVTFLTYKWFIDFQYKNMLVKYIDGEDIKGIFFILGQLVLVMITIGLYTPASIIQCYRYYTKRTLVTDESRTVIGEFGCDATISRDFMPILGQVLLVIVTIGVYYTWAYCSISKRLISQTYYSEI